MFKDPSNISGLASGMAMGVRFAGLMVKDGIRDENLNKVLEFMMILAYTVPYLPKDDELWDIYRAGKEFSNFRGVYDDDE